jgi:hypothetical protein
MIHERIPHVEAAMFRSFLLSFCLLLAACSGSAARAPAVGDPTAITEAEVRSSTAGNAYELVETLRPRWLRPGPDRSLNLETVILVYQDNTRLGGTEALRTLALPLVRSLRVLDAAQAGTLPGLGSQHVDRVIVVSTIRQ